MKTSANPMQACIDVLVSPSVAFNTIKEKKGWSWLPFILIVTASVGAFFYYFNVVDFAWLKENMVNGIIASGKSEDEAQAATSMLTLPMMQWSTIIGASVGYIVINLLVALYYLLITKVIAKNEFKFTDWYGFTWWVGMPAFISMLVAALVVFFADNGQITLQDLQPTSLNSLLFSVEQSSKWFNFLEGINLFSFWSIALAYVGIRSWLNVNNSKALIVAASPFVLIYGLWALFILL